MKKILALSALIASIGFGALSAEAKTSESSKSSAVSVEANANAPQVIRIRRGRGWRNRNWRAVRTVTRTRIVRVGFRTFRETYQITYLPNGGTRTRVISRVRVR